MKFFLAGVTEIVGWHLIRALVNRSEDVTALLNKASPSDCVIQSNPQIKTLRTNLLDTETIAEAMTGHDVVVNIACEHRDRSEQPSKLIVEGSKSLLHAASKAKVKRFIHISSICVYGEPPSNRTYTEETPRYASMALYPSLMQEAELAVLTTAQPHTEVVVLQLGLVYGPGPGDWADEMLKALHEGLFPLFDKGQGLCNLIHVDDVVDAVLEAAIVPGVNGECFIITNDQPIRWAEFLHAYEKIVDKRSLINVPAHIMRTSNIWTEYVLLREYRLCNKVLKALIKLRQFPHLNQSLPHFDNTKVKFFTAKPHFSNLKSRKILKFNPKVDVETGMESVKKWFESRKLIGERS